MLTRCNMARNMARPSVCRWSTADGGALELYPLADENKAVQAGQERGYSWLVSIFFDF